MCFSSTKRSSSVTEMSGSRRKSLNGIIISITARIIDIQEGALCRHTNKQSSAPFFLIFNGLLVCELPRPLALARPERRAGLGGIGKGNKGPSS